MNLRTNCYWVLLGIWWCTCYHPPQSRKFYRSAPSHIPAASARAKAARGGKPSHDWLETGTLPSALSFSVLISFSNQIWVALKQYKKFPHTFTYIFAYFLLADVRAVLHMYVDAKLTYSGNHDQGLNTTGTLVSICQNEKFAFSFLQNTYLGLAQAVTSTASTLGFWYIQRHWKISTKKMVSSLPSFLPWERSFVNGFSSL